MNNLYLVSYNHIMGILPCTINSSKCITSCLIFVLEEDPYTHWLSLQHSPLLLFSFLQMCHPFGSLLYLVLLQLVSVLFRPSHKHWKQHPGLLFSFHWTCHWFGSLQLVLVQMFSLFHQLHLGLLLVQVQLLSLFHQQHLLFFKDDYL